MFNPDDPFAGDKFSGIPKGKVREGNVDVSLFMRANGSYFMRVAVESMMKPKVWTRYEIDQSQYTNERDFLRRVGVAAAAAVEHQSEKYGDHHDLRAIVTVAVEMASSMYNTINSPKH
jgi:hypothetical protein